MHRLMMVDDEVNVLNALQRQCRKKTEWEIETFDNPEVALERVRTANFDLFLVDYRMPHMEGVEFLCAVKEIQPNAMRVMLSGQTDRDGLLKAVNDAEIYRFIEKPWQDYDLLATLQQALDFHDVLLENHIFANLIREQQQELEQRKFALEKYKHEHPNLFHIDWAEDGSIILDDN